VIVGLGHGLGCGRASTTEIPAWRFPLERVICKLAVWGVLELGSLIRH